jgi:hypothetical protein
MTASYKIRFFSEKEESIDLILCYSFRTVDVDVGGLWLLAMLRLLVMLQRCVICDH